MHHCLLYSWLFSNCLKLIIIFIFIYIMTHVYTRDLLISFRADELVRHGRLFNEFIRRKLHLGSCKVINLKTWNNNQIMSRTLVLPMLPTW